MRVTPAMLAAALAASYSLRDSGIPARGIKPISFTADPKLHVEVIAEALLADVAEPHPPPLTPRK